MTKKKIASLLTLWLAGSGIASAAQPEIQSDRMQAEVDTYELPAVTVTGTRALADTDDGRLVLPGGFQAEQTNFGLLGDRDVMQVPYTAQSLTTKNFDTFSAPSGDVNQVLANVPSLRVGTSLIKTDFSARGMLANGSAMYLNNVPGFFIMAAGPVTNTIGRADVMVGPAATLSGSVQSYNGPDGGQPVSVYLYTKRPEKGDFTRYRQTMGGYGHYGSYIDVNRSGLGDGTFGVRVYGEHSEGNFAVSGAGRQKTNLFVDVSRETPKSTTNLFGGYYRDRLRGTERRFQIQRTARQVPNAPDASRSYDDPNLMYSGWDGYQITLNHEQRINPHTKWFLNAGTNDMTNRRFIYWSQVTIDGDGNLRDNRVWSQYFYLKSRYGQVGVNHKFKTGAAEHDVTLAVDRSWRVQYNNTRRDAPNAHVTGNIYSGIIYNPSIYSYDISGSLGQKFQYQEMDTSINLMDNVKIGKWNLLAAVTRRHVRRDLCADGSPLGLRRVCKSHDARAGGRQRLCQRGGDSPRSKGHAEGSRRKVQVRQHVCRARLFRREPAELCRCRESCRSGDEVPPPQRREPLPRRRSQRHGRSRAEVERIRRDSVPPCAPAADAGRRKRRPADGQLGTVECSCRP